MRETVRDIGRERKMAMTPVCSELTDFDLPEALHNIVGTHYCNLIPVVSCYI